MEIIVTVHHLLNPKEHLDQMKKANPYIGENDNLEFVEEETIEFICNVNKVKKVLLELRNNHPYEEPAIDIIPLIDEEYFN